MPPKASMVCTGCGAQLNNQVGLSQFTKANAQKSSRYISANIIQVEQVHPPHPGATAKARHSQTFPLTRLPELVLVQVNRSLFPWGR